MTAKQIITKTAVNIGRLLVAVTFIFSRIREGNGSTGHAIQDNRLSGSAAYRLDVSRLEHPGDVGIACHC